MKKLVYILACCAVVASFSACKNKKVEKTAATAAKEYHELLNRDGNYEAFVDAIVFEEPTAIKTNKATQKAVKAAHARTIRTIHHDDVRSKGKLKDVRVVSEKLSGDGKKANVTLAGTYNNGVIETVTYEMVNDSRDWKIRVNDYKEVWKAVDNEGNREVVKLREDADRRNFAKAKDAEDREVIKEIDGTHRDIEKIKLDGNREIRIDRTNHDGEVYKVFDNGEEVSAVKSRITDRKAGLKEKFEGEKDFVKVVERRSGDVEVIKTLADGTRHREVIKRLDESNREIDKIKLDSDKAVLKDKEEADREIQKAKERIEGEVVRTKNVINK